jgi:phage terminase large subunit-like protein
MAATKSSTPKKRRSSRRSKPPTEAAPTWRDYLITKVPRGKTRGWEVIRWIERHCVHTNDRWTGKPFRLLTWQKMVILALFTVGDDGLRVLRWALIGIAKKNGKTELAAALALFFAFGPSGPDGQPEPSALVICAAGNDDQADLVFGAAATMAKLSPTLSQILEVFEAEITCASLPGSMVRRVAAAAKKTSSTLDGPNIYVVICDELHCWEGNPARVVWNTLTNGGVTRRQPLILQITTAGFDKDTICGEQYDYGRAVATGEVDDPRFFFWWVEPPENADHTDPAVIKAANPSFGMVMHLPFYLDQLTKKTVAVFRRYFLNQWTESQESWLQPGQWEAPGIGEFDIDVELDAWVGTDAATKHDSTAHVLGQWHECHPGCPGWNESDEARLALGVPSRKLRMKARIWERPFDPRTRRYLDEWKLPIPEVENQLRDWWQLIGVEHLKACGYDPALFERSAQQLETEGLPMEEWPQSDARMVPASQQLYQLVQEQLIEHDGDPVFSRHMRSAAAVQARGGNGGWRLSKGKTKKKMDAAIAGAICTALATLPPDEEETEPHIW